MHPFLTDEFLFDWSRLTPAQVEPDIRAALAQSRERVDAFKRLAGAELTYANVLLGFEAAMRDLSRAWGLVSHLDSVLNSPELRKAYGAMLPEVTAYFTSLTLDPEIWAVFKAYAATADARALTGVRRRFLDETMADFLENGADLPAAQKERLAAINAALAEKTQKYSENVLDSTNAWELFVEDEAREWLHARLLESLAALLEGERRVPEERLAAEVALLAAKSDVREEIDRLNAHIAEARALLASGDAVGRRLEFLTQEFVREANTLCSKSATVALTRLGLDLKAAIERLREQAANVE